LFYLMSCIHTQTYINSWLIDIRILTMEFYDSWNPWHSTSITNYQVQNQNWYKSQAQSVMWNRFHLNFYLGKGFSVLWLFVASIEIISIIKFVKKKLNPTFKPKTSSALWTDSCEGTEWECGYAFLGEPEGWKLMNGTLDITQAVKEANKGLGEWSWVLSLSAATFSHICLPFKIEAWIQHNAIREGKPRDSRGRIVEETSLI
jgi:hypothetical protein